jgi:predicted amidophosphoribosyltransferase
MSRSKEFKRTPFTDWIDKVEGLCCGCGKALWTWSAVGETYCPECQESE